MNATSRRLRIIPILFSAVLLLWGVAFGQLAVSVSSSNAEWGSVSGAGEFRQGSRRTVVASPRLGYTFSAWTEAGAVVSHSQHYSLALNAPRNLVAHFVPFGGDYAFHVQVSPICLLGTFPVSIRYESGEIASSVNLQMSDSGRLEGSLDSSGVRVPIVGRLTASSTKVSLSLQAELQGSKLRLSGRLEGTQFVGTAIDTGVLGSLKGSFTLDASAAPPLVLRGTLMLSASKNGSIFGCGKASLAGRLIPLLATGKASNKLTITLKGSDVYCQMTGTGAGEGGYLVSAQATMRGAVAKQQRSVLAKVMETAIGVVRAELGGHIVLPSGARVEIPAGAFGADQIIEVAMLSSMPRLPDKKLVRNAGRSFAIESTILASSLQRGMLPSAGTSSSEDPGSVRFVIPYDQQTPLAIHGMVPTADLVDLTGLQGYIPLPGSYDSANRESTVAVPPQLFGGDGSLYIGALNLDREVMETIPPPPLGGRVWDPINHLWTGRPVDRSKRTLVVVHGIFSSVEEAFGPEVHQLMKAGGYEQVIGFNYNWLQHPDTSGLQLATYLNALDLPSVDIVAHSFGTLTTLAAMPHLKTEVHNAILEGGPLEGTPFVEFPLLSRILFAAKDAKGLSMFVDNLWSLGDILEEMRKNGILEDVAPESVYLAGLRLAAAIGHPETRFVKIAGVVSKLPGPAASVMFNGGPNDSIIGKLSALGISGDLRGPSFELKEQHTDLPQSPDSIRLVASLVNPPRVVILPQTQFSFRAISGQPSPPDQDLGVIFTGPRGSAATVSLAEGALWLSLTHTSLAMIHGDSKTVGLRVDPSGLQPGSYQTRIAVRCAGALPPVQYVTVSLEVEPRRPVAVISSATSVVTFQNAYETDYEVSVTGSVQGGGVPYAYAAGWYWVESGLGGTQVSGVIQPSKTVDFDFVFDAYTEAFVVKSATYRAWVEVYDEEGNVIARDSKTLTFPQP